MKKLLKRPSILSKTPRVSRQSRETFRCCHDATAANKSDRDLDSLGFASLGVRAQRQKTLTLTTGRVIYQPSLRGKGVWRGKDLSVQITLHPVVLYRKAKWEKHG